MNVDAPNWKVIGGVLGGLAALVTILTYFGIQPSKHDPGQSSSETLYSTNGVYSPGVQTYPGAYFGSSGYSGMVEAPSGASLNVHSSPTLSSSIVGSLQAGTYVLIVCTVNNGGTATGMSGTSSRLWDKISTGFVPDISIDTGVDEPVQPPCA